MKALFNLVLLLALCGFILRKIELSDNETKPNVNPKRSIIEAPLVPESKLYHPQPGWFDRVLNHFDVEYMQGKSILEACQVNDIREKAIGLVSPENTDRLLNLGQLCDLHESAQIWSYLNDPAGRDYYANPMESHRTMRGDCDDYAIYLGTIISAIGFETSIVIGKNSSDQHHAFPEVCIGPIDPEIVCEYLRKRYNLRNSQPIYFRKDALQQIYISLERGRFPGATGFEGETTMRLYLTDHFIEQL